MHAGKLAHEFDRLANTGRVLYVAAHPDDENTRLLSWLANRRHVAVAYLSLTRGGGGQNLIGPEQDELLDVIRTEELLAARRLDAAQQRFTRMRDFGYSKSAAETLRIWGHEEALADVVWVIRSFRPDVIISRFSEEPPNHGHHTASAILAREAFAAAADPTRFAEQLRLGVEPWQATRLLRNVSHWREDPPPAEAVAVEVGGYDPRLGLGYGELAAQSRSQHKSQGFGIAGERGSIVERFVSVAGSAIEGDILDGIALSWQERFGAAAQPLDTALAQARADLDRDHPEAALAALLAARAAFATLPDDRRVHDGRRALDAALIAAAGLFVRATAARPAVVPGDTLRIAVEVVARRRDGMRVHRIEYPGMAARLVDTPLAIEQRVEIAEQVRIPDDAAIAAPYWLAVAGDSGRETVVDPRLIGEPTGPPPLAVRVDIAIGDTIVPIEAPVVYAWTDRVHGERLRTVHIVPPATVTPLRRAVMLANDAGAAVALRVVAGGDGVRGRLHLDLPQGWRSDPPHASVALDAAGDETVVSFSVRGPGDGQAVSVRPVLQVGGRAWSLRQDVIDHPHIPLQLVLQPAAVRLVPIDITVPPGVIGFVPGSGETSVDDLRGVGCDVEIVGSEMLRGGDLGRYAAILIGIRAYNTSAALRAAHPRLMDYVAGGGTLVVQYNTHSEWSPLTTDIGPYPLRIDRGRITDETAAMTPVTVADPLLSQPNLLTVADFAGWVQERGLYFAQTWDERYRPVFRIADPDEEPLLGGVLVADHGRGRYVYTGLAFFRQLPGGVPGAYRLLANLLAARK